VLEVEDDFDLISWDVVCEPRTPGAYIATSRQGLVQYLESNHEREGKPMVNEKLERIKNILL
jgi:hypothetical protein